MLSGCGIRYAPCDTVAAAPNVATTLVCGMRLPPSPLVGMTDNAPRDVQDLCRSNGKFKIIAFAGDLLEDADLAQLKSVAAELDGALNRLAAREVVEVSTVFKTVGDRWRYGDVPAALRSHWSK